MKKILAVLMLGLILSFEGCATNAPLQGGLFTSVSGPVAVTPYPVTANAKVGTGSTSCILGLFSFGDASIHTACASAGITKIQHVDYHTTTVLFGLFSSYQITVYGE
ncbi:MAG TPA: TRL-like family protein [bacterium]|nr:TRL-like family protein [bacterium]